MHPVFPSPTCHYARSLWLPQQAAEPWILTPRVWIFSAMARRRCTPSLLIRSHQRQGACGHRLALVSDCGGIDDEHGAFLGVQFFRVFGPPPSVQAVTVMHPGAREACPAIVPLVVWADKNTSGVLGQKCLRHQRMLCDSC